jgi:hypothetical protein
MLAGQAASAGRMRAVPVLRRAMLVLSLVGIGCAGAPAVAQGAARSTHLVIQNETSKTMFFVRGRVAHGRVTSRPPSAIPPGGSGELRAESHGFMTGTEGYVAYRLDGVSGEANFHWDNPFYGSNSASDSGPPGYATTHLGNHGNRTVVFFEIHQVGAPYTNCNARWVLNHLGTRSEPSLSAFDRDSGFFTTPLKRLGFGGWVDTACFAVASGAPVRTAQHSTDGFWTIDIRLRSMTIRGQDAGSGRFVRIEVEPGTPAHRVVARRPPRRGEALLFQGRVLIDTHHGEELIEVHPYDPIRFLPNPTVR